MIAFLTCLVVILVYTTKILIPSERKDSDGFVTITNYKELSRVRLSSFLDSKG